ncbi:MAG TPA: CBS domain-containing protein [Phototrophicaceae bacterium]|nr:CBS domain-containing protein [Phototrophicaceae bacterium]
MLHDVKVQDYMSTPVVAVETTTSIRVAQQLMEDQHVRHLPVVKDLKLVGLLSSGDIRRAGPSIVSSLSIWEAARLWEEITVEQVMSKHVTYVRPDSSVTQAVQLMMAYHFNCLPVIDHEDRPIGILTEEDIFRLVIDRAKEELSASTLATEHASSAVSA